MESKRTNGFDSSNSPNTMPCRLDERGAKLLVRVLCLPTKTRIIPLDMDFKPANGVIRGSPVTPYTVQYVASVGVTSFIIFEPIDAVDTFGSKQLLLV